MRIAKCCHLCNIIISIGAPTGRFAIVFNTTIVLSITTVVLSISTIVLSITLLLQEISATIQNSLRK
jgi:hypothetical protein